VLVGASRAVLREVRGLSDLVRCFFLRFCVRSLARPRSRLGDPGLQLRVRVTSWVSWVCAPASSILIALCWDARHSSRCEHIWHRSIEGHRALGHIREHLTMNVLQLNDDTRQGVLTGRLLFPSSLHKRQIRLLMELTACSPFGWLITQNETVCAVG